ncbi:MAG TPA: alpha/beta fold hydrolase [Intrasporangium sp.]|nr:alpha/beta fold hydrolase [Intrasporangium sp.]
MAILFLHGAGGYADDQAIADRLRKGLTEEVLMPHLSDEDMSYAAWSAQIASHFEPDVKAVVGHSFGGTTFLKMLTQADLRITRLVLLAAPDWGPEGWAVADYELPSDVDQRLDPRLRLELHHCLDDDIVPAGHLELLAARLPRAIVVPHPHGGHQFEGDALDAVIQTLMSPDR